MKQRYIFFFFFIIAIVACVLDYLYYFRPSADINNNCSKIPCTSLDKFNIGMSSFLIVGLAIAAVVSGGATIATWDNDFPSSNW